MGKGVPVSQIPIFQMNHTTMDPMANKYPTEKRSLILSKMSSSLTIYDSTFFFSSLFNSYFHSCRVDMYFFSAHCSKFCLNPTYFKWFTQNGNTLIKLTGKMYGFIKLTGNVAEFWNSSFTKLSRMLRFMSLCYFLLKSGIPSSCATMGNEKSNKFDKWSFRVIKYNVRRINLYAYAAVYRTVEMRHGSK